MLPDPSPSDGGVDFVSPFIPGCALTQKCATQARHNRKAFVREKHAVLVRYLLAIKDDLHL